MLETAAPLLAFSPILVVAILLVGLRMPASRAMPAAYLAVACLALFVWQVGVWDVSMATFKGLLITAQLLCIIFGALFLLNTLGESGGLTVIRSGFTNISPDRRVQVILIAWLFGSFIEGSAGFGTPAAVCVPLLVALGFPAKSAVISGMLIQCTPVSFGAIGTPILVGVHDGLSDNQAVIAYAQSIGAGKDVGSLLPLISARVATLHMLVGTVIPLVLVCVMTGLFGQQRNWKEGLRVWKFALFAALAMTVPYCIIASTLGPEFPSLLGGLIGMMIVIPVAKRGWLLPDEPAWEFPERTQWPVTWQGSVDVKVHQPERPLSPLVAWLPYLLVAAVLLLTRLEPLGIGDWLGDWTLLNKAFIEEYFASAVTIKPIKILMNPGVLFVMVCLVTAVVHRMSLASFRSAAQASGKMTLSASLALLFTVPMVQVFINSGSGTADLASMPTELAAGVSSVVGSAWPLLSPVVGGLGAFVAGSNTISNMMFSLFQFQVGQDIGVDPIWVVALQAVGGAAGNTICVHNVVAACAVVGLIGREGEIIRVTALLFFYYALFAGIIGMLVT
jgi:lactate permease